MARLLQSYAMATADGITASLSLAGVPLLQARGLALLAVYVLDSRR
jgi:hypothetical protein